jgi:SAM-dependent methyltransferase
MEKTLNLGSGLAESEFNIFLGNLDMIHADIDPLATHLEMICDAHYLPFQDKAFKLVYAMHVLEHTEVPLKVLREIKRVSEKAIIAVPNSAFSSYFGEHAGHFYSWNQHTFKTFLSEVYSHFDLIIDNRISPKIKRSTYRTILLLLLTKLLAPNQLKAICYE